MTNSTPLLVIGTLAGLAMALGAALFEGGVHLPAGAGVAARVNSASISKDEYDRAIEALAGDKRNPITDEVRSDVLERLIEEELLVQRGMEIGLIGSDRSVRKSIVNAMVAYVLADRSGHEPTDDEVEAFYAVNKDYFAKTERLRVRRLFINASRDRDVDKVLADVTSRLRKGEPFDEVVRISADPVLPGIPDALLPAGKLRDYIGPTLTEAALGLERGAISQPIKSGNGYHFLYVVDIQKGETPPLQKVREQVVSEYQRRSDDEALRDYLNWLKTEAEIERVVPEGSQ